VDVGCTNDLGVGPLGLAWRAIRSRTCLASGGGTAFGHRSPVTGLQSDSAKSRTHYRHFPAASTKKSIFLRRYMSIYQ
jgi:hypothetical protein